MDKVLAIGEVVAGLRSIGFLLPDIVEVDEGDDGTTYITVSTSPARWADFLNLIARVSVRDGSPLVIRPNSKKHEPYTTLD